MWLRSNKHTSVNLNLRPERVLLTVQGNNAPVINLHHVISDSSSPNLVFAKTLARRKVYRQACADNSYEFDH